MTGLQKLSAELVELLRVVRDRNEQRRIVHAIAAVSQQRVAKGDFDRRVVVK